MKFYLTLCFIFLALFSFAQDRVSTLGRKIYLNGNEYKIHGICYSPVKIGESRLNPQDYSHIDEDIALMQQACINTIRSYNVIKDVSILNKFANAGIRVIMIIPSYDDTRMYVDIQSGSYKDYILEYKDHPAILMWEFGNEYNYHPEWFDGDLDNWYALLDTAARHTHELDPNHPVSSGHGHTPSADVLAKCPNVDVWGMNVYAWDRPSMAVTDFVARSEKPCYYSEVGADSYDNEQGAENQEDQALATKAILENYMSINHQCAGLTMFSWVDGWWKDAGGSNDSQDPGGADFPVPYDHFGNEEYFGMVKQDRTTKQAYAEMKKVYCDVLASTNFDTSIKPTNVHYDTKNEQLVITDKKTAANQHVHVRIWDLQAKEHYNQAINTNIISLHSLNKGIYIVEVAKKKEITRMKIYKE